jgi:hypothetical protein
MKIVSCHIKLLDLIYLSLIKVNIFLEFEVKVTKYKFEREIIFPSQNKYNALMRLPVLSHTR